MGDAASAAGRQYLTSMALSLSDRVQRRVRPKLLALAIATATFALSASAASAKTVWLCKPGQHPDPCTPGLSTTVYSPTLHALRVTHPKTVRNPKIDCFYVYPTVSDQTTPYANREIDPEERSVALDEVARYSQYCRVYAPMYRQVTVPALETGTPLDSGTLRLPLSDIHSAFRRYLQRYSHGHEFILIGHSQGSFILRELIAKYVDPKPALRRRMLSAILLGGNVLVKHGKGIGGDFDHIRACRSDTQLHCVIAFSTFDQTPPNPSLFGRSAVAGDQVLCTNPAALGGGEANVNSIFATKRFAPGSTLATGIAGLGIAMPSPPTVWWAVPDAYRAKCDSIAGANVLELSAIGGAKLPTPSPTAAWGLHLLDASIELGNLLTVVHREATAFAKHR